MTLCGAAVLQCCGHAVRAVNILIQLAVIFGLRVPFPSFSETPTGRPGGTSLVGSKIDHLGLDQIGEVPICDPHGFDVASGLKDDVGSLGEGGIDIDLKLV